MRQIIAALGFAISFVTASTAEQPARQLPITQAQRQALGIELGIAEVRNLVPRPRLPSRITLPNSRVRMITARSPGLLILPLVAAGDTISKGDELAHIQSPSFVSLQRKYLEELSRLDIAHSTEGRERQLAEEGIIAGRRAAQSTAALREAQARLEDRRQTLVLAGMSEEELTTLRQTRQLSSTLVLRAPFAGVVLEQYAQTGEHLDAGGALYRIGNLASLTVEIHTPVDVARTLRAGMRFVIPDEDANGQVIAVGREIHSSDQGILVRGTIEDGVTRLRPGQFVLVQFETPGERGSAFAVPAAAVIHVERQAWVFRETAGGFEPIPVEILGGSGLQMVVAGELTEGSALVIAGTATLKALWLASGGPD
ncbi:MAG: efflux transporter periplasmic adaptor subunit [Deltaproteobacteria bacterium]|nr:efflux transporter periplasmic adaptor subunit [Deltaproteobacteria bacterium]